MEGKKKRKKIISQPKRATVAPAQSQKVVDFHFEV